MIYDIREGMIVRLKSGGPAMTVSKLRPNSRVTCQWFYGDQLYSESFHIMTLDLVPINEKNEDTEVLDRSTIREIIEEATDGGADT